MIEGVTNSVHAATQATQRDEKSSGQPTRSPEERFDHRADAVELSPAARNQIERDNAGPVRAKLIERVRAEIASGTYLNDDKLSAAVDRMYAALISAA
jgi:anti-sigma28 factor (negative regulator of flagellin synthesis)